MYGPLRRDLFIDADMVITGNLLLPFLAFFVNVFYQNAAHNNVGDILHIHCITKCFRQD